MTPTIQPPAGPIINHFWFVLKGKPIRDALCGKALTPWVSFHTCVLYTLFCTKENPTGENTSVFLIQTEVQRCIDEEKMREEVMGSRFLNQEGEANNISSCSFFTFSFFCCACRCSISILLESNCFMCPCPENGNKTAAVVLCYSCMR